MKFNDNYLVASLIVKELEEFGVKTVCLSPGSRNTPLLAAFNLSGKIKTVNIIDERVSGFFSLGFSKGSSGPVAIVTTSGTAVAELYPAIIEANNNGVPLIALTADRPKHLLNCGANQTINQNNIFAQNIKSSLDLGDILATKENLINIKLRIKKILIDSTKGFPGPVHINIPFKKPLEPDSLNCSLSKKDFDEIFKPSFYDYNSNCIEKDYSAIESIIDSSVKGIITVGESFLSDHEVERLIKFSQLYDFPVLCDINSQLYFKKINRNYIIKSKLILITKKFTKHFSPDLIIHFGKSFISKPLLDFFQNSEAIKLLINKEGKWWDPSLTASQLIKSDILNFCEYFINKQEYFNTLPDKSYTAELKSIEENVGNELDNLFSGHNELNNELVLVNHIINSIPENSNLVLGNSSVIRDYDLFAKHLSKNIYVYSNRGASGIDGIISTALGIEKATSRETYVIIGDLSFIYDINALYLNKIIMSKLKIIIVNNNGGGIFRQLPIGNTEHPHFEESFIVPHNINFKKIVEGFDCKYHKVKSFTELKKISVKTNRITVFEFATDSIKSNNFRKNVFNKIANL